MGGQIQASHQSGSGAINLSKVADGVRTLEKEGSLRLLICPDCGDSYIMRNFWKTKYVICTCKTKIHLKNRWFD